MNKRTGILRALTVLMGCIIALGLVVCLPGCGKNDEEIIRQEITEVMEKFKNPTKENLAEYVDDNEEALAQYEEYGIDIYEFLGHCFKHFDYTINDVTIDGDKATADLTLTNTNLETAFEDAATEFYGNIADYADVLSGDNAEQELYKILMNIVYEKLDASEETVSNDATLKLEKKDGEWELDEDSVMEVVSAMYGGVEL